MNRRNKTLIVGSLYFLLVVGGRVALALIVSIFPGCGDPLLIFVCGIVFGVFAALLGVYAGMPI